MASDLDKTSKILLWSLIILLISSVPIFFFPVALVIRFDLADYFPNVMLFAFYLTMIIMIFVIVIFIVLIIRLFYIRWKQIDELDDKK